MVIDSGVASFVAGKAHAVLSPQFLDDAGVDFTDRFFFRHLKKTAAGFFGDALHNFLAIAMRLVGRALASAATPSAATSARPAPPPAAGPASAAAATLPLALVAVALVAARIRKINGVDKNIG